MTVQDSSPVPIEPDPPYASRGGLKLACALGAFGFDVTGLACADLGASTGGFVDCLLRAGATHVFAVDTAYGILAWRLRQDERCTPIERSNALHTEPPEPVDLVTVDLSWTRQRHAVPAALQWLKPNGRIITLIKPHYEIDKAEAEPLLVNGVLPEVEAERITQLVLSRMPELGVRVLGSVRSPILGGAVGKKRKRKGTGNTEYLALLEPDG